MHTCERICHSQSKNGISPIWQVDYMKSPWYVWFRLTLNIVTWLDCHFLILWLYYVFASLCCGLCWTSCVVAPHLQRSKGRYPFHRKITFWIHSNRLNNPASHSGTVEPTDLPPVGCFIILHRASNTEQIIPTLKSIINGSIQSNTLQRCLKTVAMRSILKK